MTPYLRPTVAHTCGSALRSGNRCGCRCRSDFLVLVLCSSRPSQQQEAHHQRQHVMDRRRNVVDKGEQSQPSQTPAATRPRSVVAACNASRDLPVPPAPVSVSRRCSVKRCLISCNSWSRPTKLDTGASKLCLSMEPSDVIWMVPSDVIPVSSRTVYMGVRPRLECTELTVAVLPYSRHLDRKKVCEQDQSH